MNRFFKAAITIICLLLNVNFLQAQYNHQDTLRGSNGSGRDWWDVMTYNITVTPDYEKKSINGSNEITFRVSKQPKNGLMQIDLQQPLEIDNVSLNDKKVSNIKR